MSEKDIYNETAFPGWEYVGCDFCIGGMRYDCIEPHTCGDCDGAGFMYRHIKSGVLAEYPGGPFLGRDSK